MDASRLQGTSIWSDVTGPKPKPEEFFLAVDASNVVASRAGTMLNVGLASEILFVGTDAQLDAGDIHGRCPSWVYFNWPIVDFPRSSGQSGGSPHIQPRAKSAVNCTVWKG